MSKTNKSHRRRKKQPSTPDGDGKTREGKQQAAPDRALSRALLSVKEVSPRYVFGLLVLVALIFGTSLTIKRLFLPQRGALTISYPFDGSLFPPEIIAPTVWWEDEGSDANRWHVSVEFEGGHEPIHVDVDTTRWIPGEAVWESIKAQTVNTDARITVTSQVSFLGIRKTLSTHTVSISTSLDSVGAPIFFREVPLPFIFATANLPMMKWRLGDIGSHEPPPVVLSDLPSCGNCHSFSADGETLGMDVDVANDKGAYVLTSFDRETVFSRDKIFSWNDYFPEGPTARTFGLLARVSPDGRYVIGGMKDRAVFIPRPDLEYSQLFFPISGSLAYYDRDTRTIDMLPGADEDQYVQTNAAWTADGQYVTYARSSAATLTTTQKGHLASLSPQECAEVLGGRQYLDESTEGYTKFLYDLYTLPFNDGRGGEPVPVEGAAGNGRSNFFPKYSPDGKWLVFTQAESFMLLMPDSRLYIMPAEGGEPRLMNCNTESMNSWHSWSPNSKWLVFSSKQFSPYTQLFLTHIDENGIDSPPVLLQNFLAPDRAANIPEFVNIEPGSERVVREDFVDDQTYFGHGLRLEGFGRIDEARGQYLESLRLNPDNSESRLALALTYARQRQFGTAEEEISKIPEGDPMYGRALYLQGAILADRGAFAAANDKYRQALIAGCSDPLFDFEVKVRIDLGTSLYLLEDYDEATEVFRSVLRIDATRTDAFIHLGNIKLRQGDEVGAIREFESALELDPSLTEVTERVVQLRSRQRG